MPRISYAIWRTGVFLLWFGVMRPGGWSTGSRRPLLTVSAGQPERQRVAPIGNAVVALHEQLGCHAPSVLGELSAADTVEAQLQDAPMEK
jgi:hypothetical protein